MQYYSRRPYTKKKSRSKHWLFLILPIVVIGGILYWLLAGGNKAEAPNTLNTSEQSGSEQQTPAYMAIDLQPTVEAWEAKQAATYSIVVYDVRAGKNIAYTQPDKVLFAASLYKIYVAYLALLDIQNGEMDANEVLTGGFTRKQCVDKMIRESHSPCGEAMMADMGPTTLATRVKSMGINNTYFNGIRTTAQDSALILNEIAKKEDLNEENTAFLRDAMLTQDAKYKRGLQSGAPAAKWETKVGWNEDENYHDIGIMTMPDGRVFLVAILGQGSGSSAPIADFSKTIYAALTL